VDLVNRFLGHLQIRGFSDGTIRTYSYDLLNFLRFIEAQHLSLDKVVPTDLFGYLDWQAKAHLQVGQKVVRLDSFRGLAPSTMNRRIAAVRGLFEYIVQIGLRHDNPVPMPRRASGLRAANRGMLGHIKRRPRTGGRLVREPSRLPESLSPDEVSDFISDLLTHRDRAMALAMLLGGLRAGEVRSLLLCDVDMGLKRLKVTGKGNRQRVVPVDGLFFAELTNYLRLERPEGCSALQCFVVLRGPTKGRPLTEAGLRKIFRSHRASSGATRVRPHRLRHTYGTELASAGIDLVALRDLMGHTSPETTSLYIHLSPQKLAEEYEQARRKL